MLPPVEGDRIEFGGVRYYRVGDKLLPSVTTVLQVIDQPWLRDWEESIGAEAALEHVTAATDIGNIAHEAFDRINHYEPLADVLRHAGEDERAIKMARSYYKWFTTHVEEVVASEYTCYTHRDTGFAGTIDSVLRLKGRERPTVVDYKTSNSAHPRHWGMQVAAYRMMLHDHHVETDEGIVLLFNKDYGTIMTIPLPHANKAYAAFRSALTLWKYENALL